MNRCPVPRHRARYDFCYETREQFRAHQYVHCNFRVLMGQWYEDTGEGSTGGGFRPVQADKRRKRNALRPLPNALLRIYWAAALSRNQITRPSVGRIRAAGNSLTVSSGSARIASRIGRLSFPATRKYVFLL